MEIPDNFCQKCFKVHWNPSGIPLPDSCDNSYFIYASIETFNNPSEVDKLLDIYKHKILKMIERRMISG